MTIRASDGRPVEPEKVPDLRLLHEDETCQVFRKAEDRHFMIRYRVCGDLFQLVDITDNFVSGARKTYGTKYQSPGVFVDGERRNLVYRVAKNGSSSLSMAFDGKVFSEIGTSNFVSLDSLDAEGLDFGSYRKYFVVRDPLSRFCSSVAHHMRYGMREFSKFPKWLRDHMAGLEIRERKQAMISYVLSILKVLDRHYSVSEGKWPIDEDVHLLPQGMHMAKILKNHAADFCVRLEDLKPFIESELGLRYSYESVTGRNRGGIREETLGDMAGEVRSALRRDYEFIEGWRGRTLEFQA